MPRYTREIEIRNRLLISETSIDDLRAALLANGIKPEKTDFRLIQDAVEMHTAGGGKFEMPYRQAVRFTYYAKTRDAIEPAIKVIRSYFQTNNRLSNAFTD